MIGTDDAYPSTAQRTLATTRVDAHRVRMAVVGVGDFMRLVIKAFSRPFATSLNDPLVWTYRDGAPKAREHSMPAPISSPSFSPGQSPFNTKGTIWLGIRDFVMEHVRGGVDAVVRAADPATGSFFRQPFLPVGWYDVLPVLTLSNTVAQLAGVSRDEYLRQSSIWQARRDLNGMYTSVLRCDSPETVCRRFASIYRLMYDFGRVQILSEAPQRVVSKIEGMPEPLAPWWRIVSQAYVEPVLEAAGAANPRGEWETPQPSGSHEGMPLISMQSYTQWD